MATGAPIFFDMWAGKTIHYSFTEIRFQIMKNRIELWWKNYIINKKHMPQQIILSMEGEKMVLNLLTGRWINPNGKLFQKLIREGFIYTDSLSDYIEDIGTIYDGDFEIDPLVRFFHSALIPPLSILANRLDIREKFLISVESAVEGGMSLFTLEKNKRSSLQNLTQMNYSSANLTTLIGIIWEEEKVKAWRNNVLIKFLHHLNLASSKHRPGALYGAFIKVNVLGPERMLALAQTFY
ncbi:hypothetical protein C2G38_2043786 [Gigaspora rosea]|uniref:Uncharacterized protein n=1 Tax=Gigaspora rosea TaxID=44941 RepID=A0A397UMR0_9GLOM|nr:hypothetical protein C2G38_2043786 [Gigaspora rosea]